MAITRCYLRGYLVFLFFVFIPGTLGWISHSLRSAFHACVPYDDSILCSFSLSLLMRPGSSFPQQLPGLERKTSRASPVNFSWQGARRRVLPEDSERVDGLDACPGPNKAFLSPEICEFLPFLDFWSFHLILYGQHLVQICII